MKCRDAQVELALHAGRDQVIPAEWEEVRRHVATCVDCRVHYQRLKKTMSVLEQSEPVATYETNGSLWPEIANRLEAQPQKKSVFDGRRWLPYSSVVMACALLLAVFLHQPQTPRDPQPAVRRSAVPFVTGPGVPVEKKESAKSKRLRDDATL